jgi:site-specific DNA-methyltransferase (adenine-specific)
MKTPVSHVENIDCIEFVKKFNDKYFSLAIVDPPYGIGRDGKPKSTSKHGGGHKGYMFKGWDKNKPDANYFKELFRVSKHQIIWGVNYYTEHLKGSPGWILWDKGQRIDQADGELAYSSIDKPLRVFTLNRVAIQVEGAIHPTQKPIKLYAWLLENYAKAGDKILDTHLGSGSSRIAAYKLGFDFYAAEIDSDYYKAQEERFQKATYEPLFTAIKTEQQNLFNDAA